VLVMFVLCRYAKAGIGAALHRVGPRREMSQWADFSLACANIFVEAEQREPNFLDAGRGQ
jgi:hypothetical protein